MLAIQAVVYELKNGDPITKRLGEDWKPEAVEDRLLFSELIEVLARHGMDLEHAPSASSPDGIRRWVLRDITEFENEGRARHCRVELLIGELKAK